MGRKWMMRAHLIDCVPHGGCVSGYWDLMPIYGQPVWTELSEPDHDG